jgi:hypothetical protein
MRLGRLSAALGRATAALLALALSGVVRVAPELVVGELPHRCQCAAHGARHVCACQICRAKARAARRDAAEKLPPCHRAMALADVEREEEDERASGPCLRPSCGADPAAAPLASATDPFVPARPPAIAQAERGRALPAVADATANHVDAPPTPPPRA